MSRHNILDLDQLVSDNEMRLFERKQELGAQLHAFEHQGFQNGMAIASSARAHLFANAIAEGKIPGFGVATSMSRDGLKSVEYVLGGPPITLPNGRQIPPIPGDYQLRGNVHARFTVDDGDPWMVYSE